MTSVLHDKCCTTCSPCRFCSNGFRSGSCTGRSCRRPVEEKEKAAFQTKEKPRLSLRRCRLHGRQALFQSKALPSHGRRALFQSKKSPVLSLAGLLFREKKGSVSEQEKPRLSAFPCGAWPPSHRFQLEVIWSSTASNGVSIWLGGSKRARNGISL